MYRWTEGRGESHNLSSYSVGFHLWREGGAERSFPWTSDCCDMGAGHFLFCQYQRASGDDEKDLPGAGCDELVGKTEAVAVITAEPVGGDTAEPGFS